MCRYDGLLRLFKFFDTLLIQWPGECQQAGQLLLLLQQLAPCRAGLALFAPLGAAQQEAAKRLRQRMLQPAGKQTAQSGWQLPLAEAAVQAEQAFQ